MTINEIKNFGHKINGTFDYLLNNDEPLSLSKSMAKETSQLAEIFNNFNFNIICVLGDRYELIPIILNAVLYRKPIIHLFGGENTKGVIDEQIRHMVTKASHLHFVSNKLYAENLKNLGEESFRIHNTGVLSADAIINRNIIEKGLLFNDLKFDETIKTILINYHPVTLDYGISPIEQLENIFNALENFEFQIVVTGPNAETGRDKIFGYYSNYIKENKKIKYIESLGSDKFYNLISYCEFVIGNSSSGITDVPFFKLPSINIGDRQKGRIRHKSVIDCGYEIEEIIKAVNKSLSDSFRKTLVNMKYKLGDGKSAEKMVEIIKSISLDQEFIRK